MRRALILAGVALAARALPLAAQQATLVPAQPLTLDAAIARALEVNPAVGVADAGLKRAEASVKEARASFLPQINASANYTRLIQSQFFPDGFPPDTGAPSTFPFGQRNTWNFGITGQQILFDWRLSGIGIAKAGREQARVEVGAQRAQLELDVTTAYVDALVADGLVAVAESTLSQQERTLRETELAWRTGTRPEFDVLRARVARDGQRPDVIRRRAARELAYVRLRQLLRLQDAGTLQLDRDDVVRRLAEPVVIGDTAIERRAPVQQAAYTVKAREVNVGATRAQMYPSLVLNTQYAQIGFGRETFPPLTRFIPDWSVGLGVSFPLFNGLRYYAQTDGAKQELVQARLQLEQARDAATRDLRDALTSLGAAEEAWRVSEGTVEQARRAYEIAELRYREGLSTQTELADSRLLLEQAQVQRLQAAREYLVARTRARLLPDLPVGVASGAPVQGAPLQAPTVLPAQTTRRF